MSDWKKFQISWCILNIFQGSLDSCWLKENSNFHSPKQYPDAYFGSGFEVVYKLVFFSSRYTNGNI